MMNNEVANSEFMYCLRVKDQAEFPKEIINLFHQKELVQSCNATAIQPNSHSEQSFWSEIPVSCAFSVVVSIFIFFLGFIINNWLLKRREKGQLEQYKYIATEWAEKVLKSADDYLKYLKRFAVEVEKNETFQQISLDTIVIPVDLVTGISFENYVSTFIFNVKKKSRGENRKRLLKYMNQLVYIEKVQDVIIKEYKRYSEANERTLNEWNDSFVKLKRILFLYNGDDEVLLKIKKEFISLFLKSKEEAKPLILMQKFINPSLDAIVHVIINEQEISDNLQQGFELLDCLKKYFFKV